MDPAFTLAERLAHIRERVVTCSPYPERVRVVAVTKMFPIEMVRECVAAGINCIGENYAQELATKYAENNKPNVEMHFIGQLQRNKVHLVAPYVDVWQTMDRMSLVDTLARIAPRARVLCQVNMTNDPHRGGAAFADVPALVDHACTAGLSVEGLMCVARPGTSDELRAQFSSVRSLAEDLELSECSMGMSADFEIALREGATIIRLGTALVGERRSS